jgi:hypothetical protein
MKRRWFQLAAMLCFAVLAAPVARGQTQIQKSVIGSGAAGAAGTTATGTVIMAGTIGQTIIGHVSNSSNTGSLGFWYTLKKSTVGVEEEHHAQTGAEISSVQVAPNPVSDIAEIKVILPAGGPVSLKLYDAVGRERQTLIDGVREAGLITVTLGAQDLASGNYTLVLTAGGTHRTVAMRVVK